MGANVASDVVSESVAFSMSSVIVTADSVVTDINDGDSSVGAVV